MKAWHYALLVFIGGCCYGILSTFVKLAYAAGFTMAEVSGSQFLFGTVFTWVLVLFIKKSRTRLSFKQAIKIIISGIPMGLTGIFYYKSLQTVEASLAIIFLFQFVWIGTVLEWIFYKVRPDRSKLISIIILLFGSILATGLISGGGKELSWIGFGWGMLAACSFSAFILISGAVGNQLHPIFKSALLSTGALCTVSILFPPIFIVQGEGLLGLAPYGLLLGFFGVMLPPLLFSIGMPHVGPGIGTILSASELPTAVILSTFVLHETVTSIQWIGVVCVLIGIFIGQASLFLKKKYIHVAKD
ncbi:EamA family transporter [Lederbergia galactosidilytica]|uniref:Multidrug DMT transporter permease n=1 Tax=Lederbergia galactosidilytica TaxID=217031 RepID=A0A0Q9YKA4_9BACI|nr:DMT family transporter [Lederbergia galactosidilytica]KRG14852.1 multidrug DMT transporter permease [Virgibacillus soli]KRG16945.1 multidrug DMT transporter permease [Lederbergia galactosidilytica]MBP1914527.1 drug/metabolite transporter (DMT)-like permease [Lederbergia galactosidilytica]OAK69101.1 multidrug DMT transporter permease [Lederbergia galactosidilytica]